MKHSVSNVAANLLRLINTLKYEALDKLFFLLKLQALDQVQFFGVVGMKQKNA